MKTAACLSALYLALSGATASAAQDETGPSARIERDADRWTVTFDLDRDAPVWAFDHSAVQQNGQGPWRPGQWRVETQVLEDYITRAYQKTAASVKESLHADQDV